MNRRNFLKKSALIGLGAGFAPMTDLIASAARRKLKYLILGIDGMDIKLASAFMRLGLLPNFSRLAQYGGMSSVSTSFPPQSPVAWSSFSIGASPQVHGIYDFIHRDPQTMIPYLSTSKVVPPDKTLKIAGFEIPIAGGDVLNLRNGKPFWDYLADHDIPTTIYKMPGNFPCKSARVDMISGMGTPDLRGGYGSFTFYTTSPPENKEEITGGSIVQVYFNDNHIETELSGPANTMRQDQPTTSIPIKIWRDPQNSVIRLLIQGKEFILNQGEWTNWIELSFTMIKHISSVKGICKIFVKSIYPEFSMYVSPINIAPSDPVLPIVSSENYGKELADNLGQFYTQGMPEDTKALSYGILDNAEYLDLAYQIIEERRAAMNYEVNKLARQDEGFLFFYFSSLDQDTHMFWRAIDSKSPMYNEELGREYGDVLKNLYIQMDQCLGDVLGKLDMTDPALRLMVMSDHGFGPFRRQVNLNSWLYEQGFISLYDTVNIEDGEYFSNVDWDKTAAYALGINAIYLNLAGRERFGSLSDGMVKSTINKIRSGLLNLRDPQNGQKVVTNIAMVPDSEKLANPHAPDLIIGWNIGYRTSWSSILGGFETETIKDNDDKWSGDHCIDPSMVPAILFSNRKTTKTNPNMLDITATILSEYGISTPPQMPGKSLFNV